MIGKLINIAIFIMLLLIYFFDLLPNTYEASYFNILFYLNVISVLAFVKKREYYEELNKQYLNFTTFFLLGFLIVHFQGFLDLYFGVLDEDFQLFWVNKNNILQSFLLCSLALNAFLFGQTVYFTKRKKKHQHPIIKKYSLTPLLLFNFLFFVVFITQLDASFLNSKNYGDLSSNNALRDIMSLFYETSGIAIMIHLARKIVFSNKSVKNIFDLFRMSPIYFLILLIYLCMVLLSGDRGPVIYLLLSVVGIYVYVSKFKLSLFRFISIISIFIVLMSFVGLIRKADSFDLSSDINTSYYNRYYPKSSIPFTKELAGSIRTVNIAVDNVPVRFDFFHGVFTVQSFILVIPGINSFINNTYGIDPVYVSSARFLTYLDLGPNATWGIGTSAVADVYLDFGTIGIIIFFLLFGVIMRKFEIDIFVFNKFNPFQIILYVLYFAFSIYISRSNIMVPLAKLTYVLVFYYFLFIFKKQKV